MANETKISNLMIGVFILTIIVLGVVAYSAVSLAQTKTQPILQTKNKEEKTLTVYGIGTVKASPDQLKIVLGVVTEAKTAQEAASENAERMDRVVKALKGLGLTESNLKTSTYTITPIYEYEVKGAQKIVGYRVTNSLTITTENLDLAGKIIDEAVNAGANRITSVYFGFSDEKLAKLKDEALTKAVKNAASKAETIAKSLNLKIVGVKTVSLTGIQPLPLPPYRILEAGEVKTPIFPGEAELTVTVNVVYLIE
ncbi:hypothetical protein DRO26_04880 [Candidatus Bathyarchaeota archaeon]|nr:MAG: hypothetical protein DRO26_04880 [Candidatus Bathyarchaeota archaeon]